MSKVEHNKQLVRDYVDAFNRADLESLRGCFAPDAEIQGVLGKGQIDGILPIWEPLFEGLGMQLEIEDMIADGDHVAVRFTERGRFKAPDFGQAPTGKSYELVAMEWFVISNPKIRQRWGARDQFAQARQIGRTLS